MGLLVRLAGSGYDSLSICRGECFVVGLYQESCNVQMVHLTVGNDSFFQFV